MKSRICTRPRDFPDPVSSHTPRGLPTSLELHQVVDAGPRDSVGREVVCILDPEEALKLAICLLGQIPMATFEVSNHSAKLTKFLTTITRKEN